jgi:DNA-binding transcriptional LysR family regulator
VVGGDELVVVVAPGHRWTRRRRPLTPAELAQVPLVLREPGSGTREALERALARHGLAGRTALELGSTAAIKAAVAAGEGPAVLSRLAVQGDLASRQLAEVATVDLDLRRPFHAVWRTGRSPAGAANSLLALSVRGTDRATGTGTGAPRG